MHSYQWENRAFRYASSFGFGAKFGTCGGICRNISVLLYHFRAETPGSSIKISRLL
jgi:hypothetical protein